MARRAENVRRFCGGVLGAGLTLGLIGYLHRIEEARLRAVSTMKMES
jgi:hypothetical protein